MQILRNKSKIPANIAKNSLLVNRRKLAIKQQKILTVKINTTILFNELLKTPNGLPPCFDPANRSRSIADGSSPIKIANNGLIRIFFMSLLS
jgi:hypothetical protein